MKESIRRGVFETNSSSTHSLTIMNDKEYKEAQESKYFDSDERPVKEEDVLKEWEENKEEFLNRNDGDEEDAFADFLECSEYYTADSYNDYLDDFGYETFYTKYITPSGDIVHIFGHYGYN